MEIIGYGFLVVGALLVYAGGVLYRRRNDESARHASGMTTGRPGPVAAGTTVALAAVTWILAAAMLGAGVGIVLS